MADPERRQPGPADLRELGCRITTHPNPDCRLVGGILLSETALSGRCWHRMSLSALQRATHLSRRRTREATALLEAEGLFLRRRGGGAGANGGGDAYAPAPIVIRIRAGIARLNEAEEEEQAMKEPPDEKKPDE